MITKIFNKICLGCMLLCMIYSCSNDYLDTQPTGSIAEETATATLGNYEYILNGIHSFNYTEWNNQGYAGQGTTMLLMDFLADDVIHSSTGNGWFIAESRWLGHREERSGACLYPWKAYYFMILNVNGILANIDNPELAGSDDVKSRIKAEAIGLRAWCHFQLVQLYGERYQKGKVNDQLGVVIREDVATTEAPRSTVEEVYAFINNDLDQAISYLNSLVDSKAYNNYGKNRLNLATILGIKSRVALTQQNWSDAAKYALDAIAISKAGKMNLQKGADLLTGFNNANTNSEWIWAYTQTTSQNRYFGHPLAYISWNFSSSNIRTNPKVINKSLYETMSPDDIRREWWDPTGEKFKGMKPKNFLSRPYENHKFTAQGFGNSSGDILLMRVAEMYYIAAEAFAQSGNDAKAQDVLFQIMSTRDAQYKKSTKTGEDLLNEILQNRRIDLWGEGFRFADLKRLNMPLDRTLSGNADAAVYVLMKVKEGDKKWQFLIPRSELNANKNVVQNEL